jgi:hypothetical protein
MGAALLPGGHAQTAAGTQAPIVKPSEGAPVAAISPYIDVHTHLERAVAEDSIEVAVRAMQAVNSAKYLFLPSPFGSAMRPAPTS